MNLQDKSTELKTSSEGTLIAYISAGTHSPDNIRAIIHVLAQNSADLIVDLGVHIGEKIFPALQIHPEPCQAVFRSSDI